MNSNLIFDFTVNRENNTIHVVREFKSTLQNVWKAWTTAELLNQWWGPKPFWVETKTMDFAEGGYWQYAMKGPAGETFWAKMNYITIDMGKFFSANSGFCDEDGVMNFDIPQSLWQNTFIAEGDKVKVDILMTFDKLADLEQIINMGFKEGFSIGLDQLEELLATEAA